MSRLASLFAATTLITGVTSVYLWQQLHAERQLTAQLQKERIVQPVLRPAPAPAIEPVVVSHSVLPPPLPAVRTTPTLSQSAAMLPTDMPANLREALLRTNQTAMNSLYPDLDKALGLSAEEANALVQLLMRNAPQAEIDALVGAGKTRQLQDYQKTLESRRRMNDLKTTLARSRFPMSDEQMDRLAPTSRAEQVRRDEDLRARIRPADPRAQLDFDEETIKATEASYGRVIATARTVLSPEQLGIMQNTMNGVVTSQRMTLQTRRARLASGVDSPDTGPTPAGSGSERPTIIFTQPGGTGQAIQIIRP